MEQKRAAGPVVNRPLHFIFIADCSSSMSGGKIQTLNQAIKEAVLHMRDVAESNPNVEVLVRAIRFSTNALWHVSQPTKVDVFEWPDLPAYGVTAMGRALFLAADALKSPPMPERALPPVLVLISDGQPTDDFNGGFEALMAEPWGEKAVRLSIAIGEDADIDTLRRFAGRAGIQPLQARNAGDLVKYIHWASTAVVRAASAPGADQVSLPPPPQPGPPDAGEVW